VQLPARRQVALSVVIPAFGSEALLGRCLDAVERELTRTALAGSPEVIVCDDASPGGFSQRLRARHPGVRFLVGMRRLGFAANANRGVEAASGEVVCLLNSDMYPLPGFFEGCLSPFAETRVFAVSGRILEPSGSDAGCKRLEMCGARVLLTVLEARQPPAERVEPSPYANGGGSFFRRSVFLELGGFDPAFAPFYWEDTDLGYRAWKRGHRILYDPTRAVEHDHQGTIRRFPPRVVRRAFQRNRNRFVWHNNTSVGLLRLFAETSLKPTLRALLRLRLGRASRLVGDAAGLPRAVAARRALRRGAVVGDAELARLWRVPG
jgi:GT2 family glycosyltransferase